MDFQGPWTDHFSIKIYNQRLLSKAFKIEALERRHKLVLESICMIPGAIQTGFEVALQVFDGRIVRSIIRGQKSRQTQTFSNKASFLCPQGYTFLKNATDLFVRDLGSLKSHSIYHIKSLLGYLGTKWLYLHGFSRPLNGPFFDKNLQSKAVIEGF